MHTTAIEWLTGAVKRPLAIVSDVHGNLEAFTAVLAAIDQLKIQTIYSLGDTVGYGPDPEACTRLAMERCQVRVMGNHEYALLKLDDFNFNPQARQALEWSRARLEAAGLLEAATDLKPYYQRGRLLFVHGSVHDTVFEYVQETDGNGFSAFDEVINTLTNEFTGISICFVGHNHRPFLATKEGFIHPHDDINEFSVVDEKLYVSVGSVGQPRDGDPRACFVVFDGETIRYHRVAYDPAPTVAKIQAAGLPEVLGQRLLKGL